MEKVRIVVADDHRLILQAIQAALADVEDLEIVGEGRDGAEVVAVVDETQPDVVLLDLRMPRIDGFRALELIRQRHPDVKVIILSGVIEPALIAKALAAGASAFVAKHIDPHELAVAIRRAADGAVAEQYGVPELSARGAGETRLSEREFEILGSLARGLSNKQIAQTLWLTEQTIKFHLTNMYRKLGVANRTEAARYAYQHGLVENPIYERA